MEINKEYLETVKEMLQPVILEREGHSVVVWLNGTTEDLTPRPFQPEPLTVGSLDALVQMIRSEGSRYGLLYVSASAPDKVLCFAQMETVNCQYFRNTLYIAEATDIPGWDGKVTMSFEEAMIALRTRFQPTDDQLYTLKLLSDITTGSKITYNDNGIATSIVTKRGVDLQSNAAIKPIVTLRPYRTFQEVEQPASEFHIRVSERGITFVEADGGMWRLAARKTVVARLQEALAAEIADNNVIVML